MGCLKSKPAKEKKEEEPPTGQKNEINEKSQPPASKEIKGKAPKSWEIRPKLNKEDYRFQNRENEFLLKKPGLNSFVRLS